MPTKQAFFIAGTDTDAGKTFIACALLAAARRKGLSTAAIKPVASGCEQTSDGLRNSDALLLMSAMSAELAYEQVNPVALEPAIAPHIAAAEAGRRLDPMRLAGFCRGVLGAGQDFTLVEGAGGWRVPLGPQGFLSDLPRALELPVILVVGMKLGCINHAVLTAEAIRRDGLPLAGWVANFGAAEMARPDENFDTLCRLLPAPCLGRVPHVEGADFQAGAGFLDIDRIGVQT
ncbi:dethiobiotin synthase [Biformimicrobium ophioploci]|uniref:ATP-dependent dethiobiotin synthetase BioD n=1 Tax=Biformimicrobium ophioploci TaxID=3036711 RepID=A0ABQ6LUK7_9GAMM|nr:dethiobiotin synthase [Microbulbifer sp. NKW57]GMG85772.1 dethiobiotin synthase [Microbulbifer sp. NKW57]